MLTSPKSVRYELPVYYPKLTRADIINVRRQYTKQQGGKCYFCKEPLDGPPHKQVKQKKINMRLFPKGFLTHPVHLQHCHKTGLTEGAVHAYCNAVLWQYEGR